MPSLCSSPVILLCPTSTFVPLCHRRSPYWALGGPHRRDGPSYLGTCLSSLPCGCVRCWAGLSNLNLRDLSSSSCRVHQRWAARIVVGYPSSRPFDFVMSFTSVLACSSCVVRSRSSFGPVCRHLVRSVVLWLDSVGVRCFTSQLGYPQRRGWPRTVPGPCISRRGRYNPVVRSWLGSCSSRGSPNGLPLSAFVVPWL
jgi:hypothetical protein